MGLAIWWVKSYKWGLGQLITGLNYINVDMIPAHNGFQSPGLNYINLNLIRAINVLPFPDLIYYEPYGQGLGHYNICFYLIKLVMY